MPRKIAIALFSSVFLSTPALAQPVDISVMGSRYSATIAYYEPIVARSPKDAEAWLNLGMAYRALGRYAEARAALDHVVALDNATLQNRFDDDVWSHSLARNGLATMAQSASR